MKKKNFSEPNNSGAVWLCEHKEYVYTEALQRFRPWKEWEVKTGKGSEWINFTQKLGRDLGRTPKAIECMFINFPKNMKINRGKLSSFLDRVYFAKKVGFLTDFDISSLTIIDSKEDEENKDKAKEDKVIEILKMALKEYLK